jgi:hypothetical protein
MPVSPSMDITPIKMPEATKPPMARMANNHLGNVCEREFLILLSVFGVLRDCLFSDILLPLEFIFKPDLAVMRFAF